MISTTRIIKTSLAWTSIVYAICFAGVALFPSIRAGFMLRALHMQSDLGTNVATLGTFLSGLVIWNIVVALALWLFAAIFNRTK